MQVALVRHPPVLLAPGICYGRRDVALDPAQAPAAIARIVAALADFPAPVWTSPATRCRQVAMALGEINQDARVLELDFGAWEGQSWDAIPRAELDRWAADPLGFAPPGG